MRLTFLLLFACLVNISASVLSQQFSFQVKGESIKDVLALIETNSKYKFLYRTDIVDVSRKVELNIKNENIEGILSKLFNSDIITYKIFEDNLVVITAKSVLQQQKVTGKVTDAATGEPIPGVYVRIEGTNNGAVTDADGSYTVEIPSAEAVLQFSFVGYNSENIPVAGRSQIDVAMAAELTELDEVVVVGYGTQTKRNVTGSISTVGSDELADIPVAQVTQTLQGKISGVQINQTSGVPGKGMQIRIRGQGSILAGNKPLYVVDGFPIDGDLNDINSDEIESITVLKDAASTSLYGSRAANGVILVETKKAKAGKTTVSFSGYYGLQSIPEKGRPEMMDAELFAQFKKEIYEARLQAVPVAFQNPEEYRNKGTDWFDIMFETAAVQDYSLSLTTGTENFKTSAVLGYFNQKGTLIKSGYDRYSLRLNSEYQISKKIRIGLNIAPTYTESYTPGQATEGMTFGGSVVGSALVAWPVFEYKNEDGTLPMQLTLPGVSPVPNYYRSALEIKNPSDNLRLLSNAYLEIEPLKGLKLKSAINVQYGSGNAMTFIPTTASTSFGRPVPNKNELNLATSSNYTWLWENTATYAKSLNEHNFEILIGYTAQKATSRNQNIYAENLPSDNILDIDTATDLLQSLGSGFGAAPYETGSDKQQWALLSFLGRLNYNFKDKYLLQFAIRRDGSSRFGAENRWGNFPSVSAGWIISDESFFQNISVISLLKLRGSWGVTGNNNIGNYTHYGLINLLDKSLFGANATGAQPSLFSGSHVINMSNNTLGWETTKQWDLGVDLSLFNNRISLNYDYYTKRTTNLLYTFKIPTSTGYSEYTDNSGELKFWGHEISIQTRNMVNEFKWNTNFNISFNNNKVVALTRGVDYFLAGSAMGGYGHIVKVGEPLGLFYGLTQDGVYVSQEDFDNSPISPKSVVGGIKYVDMNDDGKIVLDNQIPGGDFTVIGNPNPKFLFGMTNSFTYKDFDLSITMSGSYGNDIANRYELTTTNMDGTFNVLAECYNYWRSEDDPGDGKYGTVKGGTGLERDYFHTRFVHDGSYLTIKNITLGYNIKLKNVKFLSSARVYGSIQQVYTFTNYPGNNPEVSNTNSSTEASALTLGDDYASTPVPRTFTIGLNFNF